MNEKKIMEYLNMYHKLMEEMRDVMSKMYALGIEYAKERENEIQSTRN